LFYKSVRGRGGRGRGVTVDNNENIVFITPSLAKTH